MASFPPIRPIHRFNTDEEMIQNEPILTIPSAVTGRSSSPINDEEYQPYFSFMGLVFLFRFLYNSTSLTPARA